MLLSRLALSPHINTPSVMRVIFLRLPTLRALLAFSIVITLYVYIRVSDVVRTKRDVKHNDVMGRLLPGENIVEAEQAGLQDGFRIEIFYSSSVNNDIMVKAYREALEVPDMQRWSKDTLPKCESKLLNHSDDVILDTLKHCGDQKDLLYEAELESWLYKMQVLCAGRFVGYGKQVALLKEVVIDRSKCGSLRNGGERLDDVVRVGDTTIQQEEFCKFNAGFFQLACPAPFHYQFKGDKDSYLSQYMQSLEVFNDTLFVDDYEQTPALALTRYEYSNIYHTTAELYNAFLATVFLQTVPKQTNIILMDSHPRDGLDNMWKRLFNTARRINDLPKKTLYKLLLWNIPGHASFLLNYSGDAPPYLSEFVEFVLNGYAIRRRPYPCDCRKLHVVLIWRQDYFSSMGNPAGEVDRKIGNEAELLAALRRRFPLFAIEGSHLERLHIKTQLHKMARTDLLVGMHGAGLTHALFLPKNSGVIELIPQYWEKADGHFAGIARWRGLNYERWVNTDAAGEDKRTRITKIPIKVLIKLVERVVSRMCPKA